MKLRLLPLASALALPLLLLPAPAGAGAGGVSETLSSKQRVLPTIMFVVDLSSNMSTPCFDGSTEPCLDDTLDVIKQVTRHFSDAQYGVVGTGATASDDTYTEIAPVGSTYAEISTALGTLAPGSETTRNFAEVIEHLSSDYYDLSTGDNGVDDDGDGFTGDWDESPVAYDCSISHVIVLASSRPVNDDGGSSGATSAPATNDIRCDEYGVIGGGSTGSDIECHYDNVVLNTYYKDHGASSLAGTQHVVVSTIGLNLDSADADDATAEELFSNAADQTGGEGMYSNASTKEEAISAVLDVLSDVMSGVYSRSTPVIANNGDWLVYTYYELTGDNPLAEGHVLGYEIDGDPLSSTYGELIYHAGSPYDDYYGALWDGGWLLYSRVANSGESNEDDMDGFNERDIYFWDSTVATYMAADSAERRLSFDRDFVDAVSGNGLLDTIFDTSTDSSGNLVNDAYDLTDDNAITSDDLQTLVDFTRGVSETQFRYLDLERGRWKLQDSPYSTPAVFTSTSDVYSNSMSYRTFLQLIDAEMMPDIVLVAANDGMLHAFALEDDENTPVTDESGEELWAWIPNTLILRERGAAWAGGLIDMMWYGRTYLFDGSPIVEDVWIDTDNDGVKDCTDLEDCEWRRVVVVQQGFGGARTLALDITFTDEPTFLWEETNTDDYTAMGMTTSHPVIFNLYDKSDSSAPVDRWVAMWGSGRPADYDDGTTDYYKTVEGNLYLWAMGDDAHSGGMDEVGFSRGGDNIGSEHPDYIEALAASLLLDADLNVEYTYISAPPAVVDVDADGDADVAYFPVTLAYDIDKGTGSTITPGQSWIYKAIFSSTDLDDVEWCEFYDPYDGTAGESGTNVAFGSRPEVYYAITTAWVDRQGHLGVYWGTGSPFLSEDSSDVGALFFMVDESPETCGTPTAITCGSEEGGFYTLNPGERLTSDPVAYAGTVYFATYTPDADACEMGTGRLYGLNYLDCGAGLDTNEDGTIDTQDGVALTTEGYVSNITIGDNGKVYYTSATDPDIQVMDAVQDDFNGTAAVGWMEMF